MQNVTLTGPLAREPEIRYTQAGIAETRLVVAVERDTLIEVVARDTLAEHIALSCSKGTFVIVVGTLDGDSSGTRIMHASARVNADNVGVDLSTVVANPTPTTLRVVDGS